MTRENDLPASQLSDEELEVVTGGDDKTRQNNKATTAQKQADKVDAYVRS